MNLPKKDTLKYRVLKMIHLLPGSTAKEVAETLKPEDSPVFGYQRRTSAAIASLRKSGLLQDVKVRCVACGCAQTRSERNVPLHLTPAAEKLVRLA